MSKSRFVRPDTTVVPISGGDTITIRKRLNYGERTDMFAGMLLKGSSPPTTDPRLVNPELVSAYLVDWSLVDDNGQKIELSELTHDDRITLLRSLDPEAFEEIRIAVQAQYDFEEALIAEEKKIPTAASAS